MDFKLVFEKLLKFFHENNVRYALMGGFALGVHGFVRSTVDIDFLLHRDDLPKTHTFMSKLGYERRYSSENVSQYTSPDSVMGEIDFIHAFREVSIGMLERAEKKTIFNQNLIINVLKIEDLVGFKLQAMANDDSRKSSDLADIESLMSIHKASLDWDTMGSYFSLFGFDELFEDLRRKHLHAE